MKLRGTMFVWMQELRGPNRWLFSAMVGAYRMFNDNSPVDRAYGEMGLCRGAYKLVLHQRDTF